MKGVQADFTMGKISFFSGENAKNVLEYLLKEAEDTFSIKVQNDLKNMSLKKLHFELKENTIGLCCGHYHDNGRWIAFDNSSNRCYVEEFPTEEECLMYLSRE